MKISIIAVCGLVFDLDDNGGVIIDNQEALDHIQYQSGEVPVSLVYDTGEVFNGLFWILIDGYRNKTLLVSLLSRDSIQTRLYIN